MIRAAHLHEIRLLPQIENAADERFAGSGSGSWSTCRRTRGPRWSVAGATACSRRGVAWNASYYARRGFAEVARGKLNRALRVVLLSEVMHGHPVCRRVVMRR
jgi:hypothetical protein